ncbi:UNVERIFIED_CONTAM: hypothetical protein K2H54_036435 [Gekko kuhli]
MRVFLIVAAILLVFQVVLGSNHEAGMNATVHHSLCYNNQGFCLLFKENCPSGKVYEKRFNDCPQKGKQKCCVKE